MFDNVRLTHVFTYVKHMLHFLLWNRWLHEQSKTRAQVLQLCFKDLLSYGSQYWKIIVHCSDNNFQVANLINYMYIVT